MNAPLPVLVYGWPGGDLAFAPRDEAERYDQLRRGTGFPMSWGEFRERFGDELYQAFLPEASDCAYSSFDEFLEVYDPEFDGPSAEQAWNDLEVGWEGRPPTDSDEASFQDSEGNVDVSPVDVTWWPAQLMLDWFPGDLARKFGRVVDSVHDGEFLQFHDGVAEELVAALEARGFTCIEDGDLLDRAAGY